jgi:hypothetical protein
MQYDKNKSVNENLLSNGLYSKKTNTSIGQYGCKDIFLNNIKVFTGSASEVIEWLKIESQNTKV